MELHWGLLTHGIMRGGISHYSKASGIDSIENRSIDLIPLRMTTPLLLVGLMENSLDCPR